MVPAASAVTLATLLSNGHTQPTGILPQPTPETLFTHMGLAPGPHLTATAQGPFTGQPHPEYIATSYPQHQLASEHSHLFVACTVEGN
ncbi:hypothetical protein Ciccas_003622 [Cichlidogyrus casuarinus]|uniref:Secreted protein n=1 Tax=Cichlidogyrus casuarinus TaxID=1844966 RepID=A0ABD2QDT1_9PLAT